VTAPTAPTPLKIALHDTALSRGRARTVIAGLVAAGRTVEEVVVTGPLADAVLAGEADLAVLAASDVVDTPGLVIGAVLKRADARDALCAAEGVTLASLPAGAKVGVGTALRVAELGSRRTDLVAVETTMDADATLALVESGELDAAILAVDDLFRLNRLAAASDYFGIDGWPTAAGQGAIAVVVRAGEEATVKPLGHAASRTLVDAERLTVALTGVTNPVAVNAIVDDGMLFVSARVYSADGSQRVTSSHALYVSDSKDPAGELAARVSAELLDLGAAKLP